MMKTTSANLLIHLVIGLCIQSCAKNPTNPSGSDPSNPQILYFAETVDPEPRKSFVLVDANQSTRKVVFSVTNGSIWSPSFSPDGNKILFARSEDNEGALYTIDVDGKNLQRVSGITTDGHFPFGRPQFMRNGVEILYMKRITSEEYELRILNSEDQQDRFVAKGDFYFIAPEITDDGQWIIVWDNGSLYRLNSENGDRYVVASNSVFGNPFHLSKKSNEIVFRSYDPSNPADSWIGKVNLDGSGYQKFSFSGQLPRMSEDASHILYVAMHKNRPSIWIANADGSEPRVVTSNWTWDMYVQFFPASDRILFIRRENDHALFSCDLQGGNQRQLTPFDCNLEFPRFRP